MKWTRLFKDFFDSEKTGGVLLPVCRHVSLLVANSAWRSRCVRFWHRGPGLSFDGLELNYAVEQWIKNGLMTVFFSDGIGSKT